MYGLGALLVRQADIETDGLAARLRGAAIRRLHDAPASARANDVAMLVGGQRLRPFGDQPRKLARLLVVASERTVRLQPGRAEEHDRVVNAGLLEASQRLEVFREDAQRPRRVAFEE